MPARHGGVDIERDLGTQPTRLARAADQRGVLEQRHRAGGRRRQRAIGELALDRMPHRVDFDDDDPRRRVLARGARADGRPARHDIRGLSIRGLSMWVAGPAVRPVFGVTVRGSGDRDGDHSRLRLGRLARGEVVPARLAEQVVGSIDLTAVRAGHRAAHGCPRRCRCGGAGRRRGGNRDSSCTGPGHRSTTRVAPLVIARLVAVRARGRRRAAHGSRRIRVVLVLRVSRAISSLLATCCFSRTVPASTSTTSTTLFNSRVVSSLPVS